MQLRLEVYGLGGLGRMEGHTSVTALASLAYFTTAALLVAAGVFDLGLALRGVIRELFDAWVGHCG